MLSQLDGMYAGYVGALPNGKHDEKYLDFDHFYYLSKIYV
jgi:hypothetical protein